MVQRDAQARRAKALAAAGAKAAGADKLSEFLEKNLSLAATYTHACIEAMQKLKKSRPLVHRAGHIHGLRAGSTGHLGNSRRADATVGDVDPGALGRHLPEQLLQVRHAGTDR